MLKMRRRLQSPKMRARTCAKPTYNHLDADSAILKVHFELRLPPVSAPSCWFSNSTNCCSRSISMIRGTRSTRQVVAVIQPALPVDFSSFQATVRAVAKLSCSPLALLPWTALPLAILTSALNQQSSISSGRASAAAAWLEERRRHCSPIWHEFYFCNSDHDDSQRYHNSLPRR